MDDSFLKRWSRLQRPAQQRYLLGTQAPRGKLFERTEANAVSLAQGAIDGAGFGHAHLGIVEDQRRDIAGMSVAVADEATAPRRFEDCRLEHPEVLLRPAQCKCWLNVDTSAAVPFRQPEQFGVSDIWLSSTHLIASCGSIGATRIVAADHRGSVQPFTWSIINDNHCQSMIYIWLPFVKRKIFADKDDMP
jgi:hypothetical protein